MYINGYCCMLNSLVHHNFTLSHDRFRETTIKLHGLTATVVDNALLGVSDMKWLKLV